MSQIDVNNLLSQMRQLSSQVKPAEQSFTAAAPAQTDFSNLLKQSIASVADAQTQAGQLAAGFERGDAGADLGHTMVAINKADLSLNTLTQVRNKLVDAYNNIMNMPV
ncbi:flagellar hook-basal body complex protein FliE [Dyella solisilvae]|uniref:Flagellar hook-basal body complex protein FliE n=1 Tax=Dyella solisilvae TaxID=1920168 RepID=A0A370K500_9GAMM|nr:flagellar hook-basal body complex protein FliE [Dyella solisilvae]RDI97729.1 flagellar hook-basal body complex protein FliE [Dyella solisilvae]